MLETKRWSGKADIHFFQIMIIFAAKNKSLNTQVWKNFVEEIQTMMEEFMKNANAQVEKQE